MNQMCYLLMQCCGPEAPIIDPFELTDELAVYKIKHIILTLRPTIVNMSWNDMGQEFEVLDSFTASSLNSHA